MFALCVHASCKLGLRVNKHPRPCNQTFTFFREHSVVVLFAFPLADPKVDIVHFIEIYIKLQPLACLNVYTPLGPTKCLTFI